MTARSSLAPTGNCRSSVEYGGTSRVLCEEPAAVGQRIYSRLAGRIVDHRLQHEAVVCIVVAAKGADSDRQRDVHVGSRLIRNPVGAAYKVKRRQVPWLLLSVEPGKQSLPQSITGDFRFVGDGHPVGAESQACAAQECRP